MAQITTNQQFVNPAFAEIFDGITARMPRITFYGIIVTYLITAGLNVYTIHLPLYVSIPTALAIQYGRFAVVFKNFLNPLGTRSRIPEAIATLATVVSVAELAYSLQNMGLKDSGFWSVFLFGTMVIAFGYILEMGFIDEGAKAFGMTHKQGSSGALVQQIAQQQQNQNANPLPDPAENLKDELQKIRRMMIIMDDEAEELRNQVKFLKQGNGQAPIRPKQATANMGHSTNGTNGYNLNHHNP
ncbi:hypothetical protein [Haliscomenobacter sp.]|uniref:hypothetical protein n=1 Tax=Haliscomenobacter sp. TaxID=2717303 RepID=UPI003BA88995